MTDEQQSDFPTAWRPEPGETITGKMLSVEVIDPAGQGPYPCVTIQTSSGEERAIHAFHTVLQTQLAKRRPKPGDELSITYLGKVDGANRPYHSYRVVGGEGQAVNWDNFLPESDRQPANLSQRIETPVSVPAQVAPSTPQDTDLDDLPF